MKKTVLSIFSIVLSIGLLTGCGQESAQPKTKQTKSTETEQAFPVTVKDGAGKEVVIEEKPERIISLLPSSTEIAYELGLGDKIVAVTDNDTYPEEVKTKEKVGGMEINIEKVISLKPDLVLAEKSIKGLEQLTNAGIDVVTAYSAQNFDQVYDSIELIGQATGTETEAKELIESMKEDLAEIEKKAETITEDQQKSVFVEVSPAPEIYTTGKNTFMQEMLEMIHAKNIASNQEGWVKMNEEAIIQANPDVIITTYGFYTENAKDQVLNRAGWENIKAIQTKQVIDVNSDLVNRPGPRLVEGVEELAEAVYPDVFKE